MLGIAVVGYSCVSDDRTGAPHQLRVIRYRHSLAAHHEDAATTSINHNSVFKLNWGRGIELSCQEEAEDNEQGENRGSPQKRDDDAIAKEETNAGAHHQPGHHPTD